MLLANSKSCGWKGPRDELLPHCKLEHKYSIAVGDRTRIAW